MHETFQENATPPSPLFPGPQIKMQMFVKVMSFAKDESSNEIFQPKTKMDIYPTNFGQKCKQSQSTLLSRSSSTSKTDDDEELLDGLVCVQPSSGLVVAIINMKKIVKYLHEQFL